MLPLAAIRQYAVGQQIAAEVADLEIVLTYALALFQEEGLTGRRPGATDGPLLFKGGTALRKCVFGTSGRFSRDLDFDAARPDRIDAEVERVLTDRTPYHGIRLAIGDFRFSHDENFSATIRYEHTVGVGQFELQISYRTARILDPQPLPLVEQPYFPRLECRLPELIGLDPYEMVGEKIMACNRRLGGSGKDVYDLYLWASRPFSEPLVRRIAFLKSWTDRRRGQPFSPAAFLTGVVPENFRWTDLGGLIPRQREADAYRICETVRTRFAFLDHCSAEEEQLLNDQQAHREPILFEHLCEEARDWVRALAG